MEIGYEPKLLRINLWMIRVNGDRNEHKRAGYLQLRNAWSRGVIQLFCQGKRLLQPANRIEVSNSVCRRRLPNAVLQSGLPYL